jgi:copper(I)-binding protein
MKKALITSAILFTAILFITACTEQGKPEISVEGAKYMKSPMIENASAVFMIITNDGKVEDRVLACSIKELPAVKGELHDVIGGKMQEIKEIVVQAGGMTVLKKGSLHLMFFNVPEKMEQSITVVMEFEKSGKMEVTVPVK